MCLLKGLGLILLLVVAATEGVDEPVGILIRGNKQLRQRVSELEEEVKILVEINEKLQADVKNLKGEIGINKKQVAFSGNISRNIPSSELQEGSVVIFDAVTTNIGNAYNTDTGIFRCPFSGLYLFSCDILATTPGIVALTIYQNDVPRARPRSGESGVEGYSTASNTIVVHAKEGDQIYLEYLHGDSKELDSFSRFTGVLLKAD